MAESALEKAIEGLETAVEAVEDAAKNLPAMSEDAVNAVSDAAHGVSGGAIDPFVFRLAIFVLSIFIGYFVVWSVTPALHTPLMAVTNAISSVIVVGALLSVAVAATGTLATTFGFIGLVLASVNIFGGFLVTQRMLAMYKKKER
jgi:NAD(P) transhydrogenase subunit alpha